jgi:PTH1 family peptidyl-tRNA hydrolase
LKIVVGLGNPGREYAQTRHNVGFQVADELARRLEGVSQRSRFRATVREGVTAGIKFVIIQPRMYMNLSGIPVREAINWYKIDLGDLLVVYDDMDLPLGQLRVRPDGSAGGHNGMKSIISELGTDEFTRLRIGIGRGGGASVAHVLSRFTAEETAVAERAIAESVEGVLLWAARGNIEAMNAINRPVVSPEPGTGVA